MWISRETVMERAFGDRSDKSPVQGLQPPRCCTCEGAVARESVPHTGRHPTARCVRAVLTGLYEVSGGLCPICTKGTPDMRLTISDARAQLGYLCTRAQDPREVIVLTRHGNAIAALVSISEVKRIWDMEDEARAGWRHPLSGLRGWWSRGKGIPGMEPGPGGKYVTKREAAVQVREIQMTRAEERRILQAGGLEVVEGGEIAERVDKPRKKFWKWFRSTRV